MSDKTKVEEAIKELEDYIKEKYHGQDIEYLKILGFDREIEFKILSILKGE